MVRCGPCGRIPVPYPLSTGPNCGDQAYNIRCTAGALWFDALKGSYMIISINPLTQRIILRPPSFLANTCVSGDIGTQGIQLDDNLPFNITGTECMRTPLCVCSRRWLANRICGEGHDGGCLAYQSFVNFDTVNPPKKWPEPGLEIEWASPQEPVCKTQLECKNLFHSSCLADPMNVGSMRCLCKKGFTWDPINGLCRSAKCRPGKRCKNQKKLTVLAIMIGILVHKQRQRIKKELQKRVIKEREEMLRTKNNGKSSRIFTGKEITRATNNFSVEKLIGSGGFGEVFKGTLDDGTLTAIKRAKLGNTKGTDQILNEVRILCQVNHRCLVRLLGCCVELDHPLLIYEFIPNGTLFDHLHCHLSGKYAPLTWLRRLHIAHQTSEGLAYLHFAAVPPIYHRDVKSCNILLDEKLNAKVADFGLSRLIERTEGGDSHIYTSAQGTLGYSTPNITGTFSSAIGATFIASERLMEVVDPVIKEGSTNLELETIKALGLLAASCLDDKRQNRPSMKEVADEIEYIISIASGEISDINVRRIPQSNDFLFTVVKYLFSEYREDHCHNPIALPLSLLNFLKEFEKKLDTKITCSQETEPLGTEGPLALARDKLIDGSGEPFSSSTGCYNIRVLSRDLDRLALLKGSFFCFKVDEPSKYVVVMDELLAKLRSRRYLLSVVIGDGCLIGPDVAIGPGCVIESGVRLLRCSVMRGVRIKKHSCVSNSIIGWHSTVGKWVRLENMTILGEDVHIGDEVYSNGGVVLPHKEIKSSILKPEIVM
ncbi:Wall-associated receptor kinase-like 20 [Hibiscus syriacus]|uniref:Wall-associated receptor kinase-like 20 n=1 Tax=Hibiscus syriacus TaxID=106335 RepID=A0A6A2ZX90_HIBSY|nr:Wall-associated receptor kinase-like 20 [Hibiscus syriacus]